MTRREMFLAANAAAFLARQPAAAQGRFVKNFAWRERHSARVGLPAALAGVEPGEEGRARRRGWGSSNSGPNEERSAAI